MRFIHHKQIKIDGQARSGKIIDRMLQTLAASKYYAEVNPGKQIPRQGSGQYPESFKINLTVARKHKTSATQPNEDP